MASIRSLVVKIGADTQAIESALAKVGASTKNLDEGLKKLGNTPLGKQAQQDAERLQKSIDAVRAAHERLAQGAQLAARGIDAIGGPARLTRNELEQMNRSLQQGLDGFRALGDRAPKDIAKVEAAAKAVQAQLKQLQQPATPLLPDLVARLPGGSVLSEFVGGGVGAGIAAGATAGAAAFAFATKQAIDYADALVKVSDRTGIAVEPLQRLEAIAIASGNSLSDLANGVNQFQRRLAEGAIDKEIRALNISLDVLRRQNPDEQFITLAKAIQQVKDPAEQTRVAMEIFGRAGAQLLPSLKADVDKLAQSTFTMSEESVKALDAFGDAVARAKTSTLNFIGELAGKTITITLDVVRKVRDVSEAIVPDSAQRTDTDLRLRPQLATAKATTQEFQALNLEIAQQIQQMLKLESATKAVGAQFKAIDPAVAEALTDALLGTTGSQLKAAQAAEAHQKALEAINAKIREAERPITILSAKQRELAVRYREFGLSNAEIALKLDVSTRSVESFVRQLDTLRTNLQKVESGGGLTGALGFGKVDPSAQLKPFFDLMDRIDAIQSGTLKPIVNPAALTGPIQGFELIQPSLPQKLKESTDGINELARSLSQLAQISDQSFASIARGLATMVGAIDVMRKSLDTIKSPGKGFQGLLNQISGGISLGIAAFQLGKTIFDAFHQTEAEKIAFDTGRDLGVQISDGLAKQLEEDSKRLGRQATQLLHLDQIINEAGGVEAFGFDKAVSKARDLFSMLETGQLTAQQVGQSLDKVFGQLVPNALSKTSRLASDAFVELQTLAIRNRISAPSIDQFRSGQIQTNVLGGLDQFLKSGTAIGSQATASGLGDSLAAGFAEMARQGTPVLEIVKQLDPLIGQLSGRLMEAGLGGGFAFDTIFKSAALAKDEFAGPAFEAIDGLGKILAGLSNTGLLTKETFSGLTTQIGETFAKLEAQGKGGSEAIALMQQPLQTIFELQQRTGFVVDETTQRLLDQAVAQGIVGDQFKSSQERTIDALNRTNTILVAIADALGAKLPAAARTGADQINKELDRIEAPTITIGVGFDVEAFPTIDPSHGPIFFDGAATGGRVTPNGIQHFATGGVVLPFAPRGTDTVPALLTPGEIVLNAAQQQNLGSAIAESGAIISELRLLRAALLTQPETRVSLDGREFIRALHERYDRNKGGERTDLQSILGAA